MCPPAVCLHTGMRVRVSVCSVQQPRCHGTESIPMRVAASSRCDSRLLMYGHTSLAPWARYLHTESHCQACPKTVEGMTLE